MWLKRRTPQNIVIGGAAGAFPPMIGWAAVTGQISLASIALFLLIFMWTPPHFWALALYRTGDYAKAGVPMLPVVAGARATKAQMLVYTVLLFPLAAGAVGARPDRCCLCGGGRDPRPALHPGGGARLVRQRRAGGAADVRLLDPLSLPAVHPADRRPRARPRRREPGMMAQSLPTPAPNSTEQRRRRRARNRAVLLVLLLLVALIYVISIVRMSGG